ncbi:type VI secretion system-associated protein TagF [Sulfurirhabdus autotrophica]|uniref:Type VI secretion system protein ImpM n=1 Tax=Sulfurirhabdus autotrophica TaxID=1706046 RepID=A0A4R3XQM8_9PROT|nr:type VI secretion system-associated protein TagF [Sulfurirhabdus autotrophica]TCV81091.1 type VI secretion system protein ImpM [Sulfurirhabdus autotrophica]
MSNMSTQTRIGYFGKIPARGDFIKATDNMPLIHVLDDWLAQAMELLSHDPRWKITYDAVQPFHFAFIGPRSNRAIAGHLVASNDQANRRFPFLTMSTMEIEDSSRFVASSPMMLSRLWNRLETQTVNVLSADDPTPMLQNLSTTPVNLELDATAYEAAFTDFLEFQTMGVLGEMLAHSGFKGSPRQLMLALGLLLQPVMASSSSRLDKSLILPLPVDPMYRYLVAAFWMHLITPFLMRADFELSLFFAQIEAKPSMIMGFSGASARTLHAIMDPLFGLEHHISFDNTEWVEEQINTDYGMKKLSAYLAQPNLSLKSAHDSFHETFIGT